MNKKEKLNRALFIGFICLCIIILIHYFIFKDKEETFEIEEIGWIEFNESFTCFYDNCTVEEGEYITLTNGDIAEWVDISDKIFNVICKCKEKILIE